MATFLTTLFSTFLIILAASYPSLVTAHTHKEFKVGDSQGWRHLSRDESELYTHWASKHRFHIGDSLRFCYKNDSIVVIDKWGYYHCDTRNAYSFNNDGNTLIPLEKPGPIYFISGDSGHCVDGQRFEIDVIPLHPKSHSPPAMWSPAPSPSSNSGTSASVAVLPIVMGVGFSLVGLFRISMV